MDVKIYLREGEGRMKERIIMSCTYKRFFLVTIKRLKDSRFKKNNEKQRNSFFLVYLDFLLLIINVTYRNLLEFFE